MRSLVLRNNGKQSFCILLGHCSSVIRRVDGPLDLDDRATGRNLGDTAHVLFPFLRLAVVDHAFEGASTRFVWRLSLLDGLRLGENRRNNLTFFRA